MVRKERDIIENVVGAWQSKVLATVAIAVCLVLVACSSGSDGAGGTTGLTAGPDTVEWKLAVVDAGGNVLPDDPVVREFATALTVLEELCYKNTRHQIGDIVLSMQGSLLEYGISESLLTILQAIVDPVSFEDLQRRVNQAVDQGALDASARKGDCAAYMTVYVIRRATETTGS